MWGKAAHRLCALAAVALLLGVPESPAATVHSGYPQWQRFFDRELTAADGHQSAPQGDKRRFGLTLPDDNKVEGAKRRFGLTLPDDHMMQGAAKRRFGLTLPNESMVEMKRRFGLTLPNESMVEMKRRFGLMLPNESMVEAKRRFSLLLPDDKLMGTGGGGGAAAPRSSEVGRRSESLATYNRRWWKPFFRLGG